MDDPRDLALRAGCPVLSVPRFGSLGPMAAGQRVLVAADAVFLQVKRRWIDCICRIGDVEAQVPLPFGTLTEHLLLPAGPMPLHLMHQFSDQARQALPAECGAVVTLDGSGEYRLRATETISASAAHLCYRLPELDVGEEVVLDIHSHGTDMAYFSANDNADDMGIKFSAVLGSLHRPRPSMVLRVVLNGWCRELPVPEYFEDQTRRREPF